MQALGQSGWFKAFFFRRALGQKLGAEKRTFFLVFLPAAKKPTNYGKNCFAPTQIAALP
jgi:hypothetical protein